jgi:drug/metabolite transporter superfamily protein YnfA
MSANFVGICFLLFMLGLLAYFLLGNEKYLPVAVFGFAMMLPCSSMFLPSKNKNALLIYTVAMALVGLVSIFLTFQNGEIFNTFSGIFIFGFVAFQWVANYMLIRDANV